MPDYTGLRAPADRPYVPKFSNTSRLRAIDGLLALRAQLKNEIPGQNLRSTLLVATWNIREFDSEKYGARCEEAYYYISEIVSHFDLVAVQEVRADLMALKKLMRLMGPWWDYIVTDVTLGTSGNKERLAFLFDRRKVVFTGLAGELVLPDPKGERALQFARTPFLCGFQSGWCKFTLCTVHIYYGKSVKDDPRRINEIGQLASTLAAIADGGKRRVKSAVKRSSDLKETEGENLILIGDFNIFNVSDVTFGKLRDAGFEIPKELQGGKGSNLASDKHYDQIAYLQRAGRFKASGRAGVFDFQRSVFARDEYPRYKDLITPDQLKAKSTGKAKDPQKVYNDWRTYQMSDHMLMWAEFHTDFATDYLERCKESATAKPADKP